MAVCAKPIFVPGFLDTTSPLLFAVRGGYEGGSDRMRENERGKGEGGGRRKIRGDRYLREGYGSF